ncbi:MAG: hypothetical protein ACE5JJ_04215 [Nitrospinota bacterium]
MARWLAVVLGCLLASSGAHAAEKSKPIGYTATVQDVSGTETVVRNFRPYAKGKESERHFIGQRGAGQVVIPFRQVRTLEVRADQKKGNEVLVIVTDWKGERQEFYASGWYMGELPVGQFFIEIPRIRKITFHRPRGSSRATKK